MIVAIKNRLALIISSALESYGINAKVIQNNFNEDTENKPQSSKQIVIAHRDSTLVLKSQKDQSYQQENRFDITVTVKDLRSDDPVQNIVDLLCASLIGSVFGGIPVKDITATSEGFTDGLWKYVISLTVVMNSIDDKDPDNQCLLDGVTDLDFSITLSPSYNQPLRG